MTQDERDLLGWFRALGSAQRETLLAFAEFLAARGAAQAEAPPVATEPLPIPRPEQEPVVQAIKRLRLTYPMLDHGKMLTELSSHMTQHLVFGKPAQVVIDEIEAIFRRDFEERSRKDSAS